MRRAVLIGTAKLMPCTPRIAAVFTPTTSPRLVTSGPPELPGFSAASVCTSCSISRPDRERSERPSALTTPAVTVCWNPYGLPIAMTTWPGRRRERIAERAPRQVAPCGAESAATRIRTHTAMSVSGSAPTIDASRLVPSAKRTSTRDAFSTTWLLVRISPSGENTRPDPEPSRRRPRLLVVATSIFTTDGPTRSTAFTTAVEYASSSCSSVGMRCLR